MKAKSILAAALASTAQADVEGPFFSQYVAGMDVTDNQKMLYNLMHK
eukprot:CAMPEP_0170480626 /NCGR_PEP_ID=MMETSP0208-20121228/1398_1 /TAXON_ID=197538 /ORGANISM="Strombidium inclinatum, Strain S3" /LENGTH=46 /DNA_ID= /DNA_START= /DNA_END= /DNA_ORIENTATION=